MYGGSVLHHKLIVIPDIKDFFAFYETINPSTVHKSVALDTRLNYVNLIPLSIFLHKINLMLSFNIT
jgi:hypothetical protein